MSTSLDPKIIKNVSEKVYKRFPEVSGVSPSVRKQSTGKNNHNRDSIKNGPINYLLIYRGMVDLGKGKKMVRWIRVVVSDHGKILKMTTSR